MYAVLEMNSGVRVCVLTSLQCYTAAAVPLKCHFVVSLSDPTAVSPRAIISLAVPLPRRVYLSSGRSPHTHARSVIRVRYVQRVTPTHVIIAHKK